MGVYLEVFKEVLNQNNFQKAYSKLVLRILYYGFSNVFIKYK